jgi:hypothetical protein
MLDDRDDAALAQVVDALVASEAELAALEAARAMQFAAAMRIALARGAHKPKTYTETEMHLRSIAAEIATALHWHDRTVQARMGEALLLVEQYPTTVDALSAGRISARHAAAIRIAGCGIDDPDDRAAYERIVLERAERDTPARTEAFARIVAEEFRPTSITERFEEAQQSRRVWVQEDGDGMGTLGVFDSVTKVRAMYDRLTRQARAIRQVAAPAEDADVDDRRTTDQTRADLVCDLILTGQPAIDPTGEALPGGLGAIRASVSVTVPALTAAGVSDRGASIDGLAPIDADTARRLMAGAAGWDRILTHPITGAVLAVDRYRAGPVIERFLAARDVHCRFPGCRRAARACDHDHNLDYARGGATSTRNMACLCKRHHTLKTETEWTAAQLADGTIRWTTPLGRTTDERPERHVAFRPDPDPPPF